MLEALDGVDVAKMLPRVAPHRRVRALPEGDVKLPRGAERLWWLRVGVDCLPSVAFIAIRASMG